MYEVKPNTGSLWMEPKKMKSQYGEGEYDAYGGSFKTRCSRCGHEEEHWLNGTKRTTDKGKEVMNLKLKPKGTQTQSNDMQSIGF